MSNEQVKPSTDQNIGVVISERHDEKSGQWYAVRQDNERTVFHAHRGNENRGLVTVFWGGLINAHRLTTFFEDTYPRGEDRSLGGIALTDSKKIRLAKLNSNELMRKIPQDTRFLRLESRRKRRRYEYVVWASLASEQDATDKTSLEDDIGVFLNPPHLKKIRGQLTSFINDTHILHPAPDTISKSIDVLSHRLETPERIK